MAKKNITATPDLKVEHCESTLEYNGQIIDLQYASEEVLADLYSQDIWKYLFNI